MTIRPSIVGPCFNGEEVLLENNRLLPFQHLRHCLVDGRFDKCLPGGSFDKCLPGGSLRYRTGNVRFLFHSQVRGILLVENQPKPPTL